MLYFDNQGTEGAIKLLDKDKTKLSDKDVLTFSDKDVTKLFARNTTKCFAPKQINHFDKYETTLSDRDELKNYN